MAITFTITVVDAENHAAVKVIEVPTSTGAGWGNVPWGTSPWGK